MGDAVIWNCFDIRAMTLESTFGRPDPQDEATGSETATASSQRDLGLGCAET